MSSETGAFPLSRGYRREDRVEREIGILMSIPLRERRRWALGSGPDGEPLSEECTVFLIRDFVRVGQVDKAWEIARHLAGRMARRITRRLAVWRSLASYQREEAEEALLERLYRVWLSREPADEFWEVRFNLSLDRALADEVDRVLRHARHELTLAADEESGHDPWDIIADQRALSPEDAAVVADALAALPEPLRTAFWLHCREEWTEEEIGAHLACTSRTVRNYLRRARERLATWRGTEA